MPKSSKHVAGRARARAMMFMSLLLVASVSPQQQPQILAASACRVQGQLHWTRQGEPHPCDTNPDEQQLDLRERWAMH